MRCYILAIAGSRVDTQHQPECSCCTVLHLWTSKEKFLKQHSKCCKHSFRLLPTAKSSCTSLLLLAWCVFAVTGGPASSASILTRAYCTMGLLLCIPANTPALCYEYCSGQICCMLAVLLQAAWLLQLCGTSIPTPKEFEDPNATLQALLQAMRSLGFANPSYPPSKLSSGHGKEVCAVIDGLLDMAIERKGVVIRKPVYSIDRYGAGRICWYAEHGTLPASASSTVCRKSCRGRPAPTRSHSDPSGKAAMLCSAMLCCAVYAVPCHTMLCYVWQWLVGFDNRTSVTHCQIGAEFSSPRGCGLSCVVVDRSNCCAWSKLSRQYDLIDPPRKPAQEFCMSRRLEEDTADEDIEDDSADIATMVSRICSDLCMPAKQLSCNINRA